MDRGPDDGGVRPGDDVVLDLVHLATIWTKRGPCQEMWIAVVILDGLGCPSPNGPSS